MSTDIEFPFDALFREDIGPSILSDAPKYIIEKVKYASLPENFVSQLNTLEGLAIRSTAQGRKKWIPVFPQMDALKYLEVDRANQQLFDSICNVKGLQRLSITISTIEELDGLALLTKLTHFCLESWPRVKSLNGLKGLNSLRALVLSGFNQNVSMLNSIEHCLKLEGLCLCGQDYKAQSFETLKPIEALNELRYLGIGNIKLSKDGLKPASELHKLEFLYISPIELKKFPKSDYVAIYENCPNIKGDLIRLAATDKEFQKKYKIS